MATGIFKKCVFAGNKRCQKIVDEDIRDYVREEIQDSLGVPLDKRRFKVLDQKALSNLERNKRHYRVSYDTAGKPYILYLTELGDERHSLFVKRVGDQIISTEYGFPKDCFDNGGTILDGKMLKTTDNKFFYIIEDIHLYKGKKIPYKDRSKTIMDLIKKNHKNSCRLFMKKFFDHCYIRSILEDHSKSLPFQDKITGLIFRSPKMSYIFKTDTKTKAPKAPSVSKTKTDDIEAQWSDMIINDSVELNTDEDQVLTLVATDMPEVYELYKPGDDQIIGYASIPDMKTAELIEDVLEDTGLDRVDFKCSYSKEFQKWSPYEKI